MNQHVRYSMRNMRQEEVGFLDLVFEEYDKVAAEIFQVSLSGEQMARYVRIDGTAQPLWAPLEEPPA
jgi:hypothetical protein